MPNTLPCALCKKAFIANENIVIRKTPVHFHCNNRACTSKDQWHIECICNQMYELSQVTIRCRHCKNDTTIKTKPWLISRALRFSWIQYPRKYSFVLNRVLDIFASAIGMCVMIWLYAAQPYSEMKLTNDIRDRIIYHDVPAQIEHFSQQLTNAANPQLAVATMAAMWVLGWMTISFAVNLFYYIICIIIRRNVQQAGKFVVE